MIDVDDAVRRAVREARAEGSIALAVAIALLVGLGLADQAEAWPPIGAWWLWIVVALPEVAVLVLLLLAPTAGVSPGRRRSAVVVGLVLLVVADLVAVSVLLTALVTKDTLTAGELLAHGLAVWLTNLIIFALLFWELDGGGPRMRAERGRDFPDFQFPQDMDERYAAWHSDLPDYVYVSLTNSIAVSPTDTMPLTHRAKLMMGLESLISYSVVVLVVARAINVLGS